MMKLVVFYHCLFVIGEPPDILPAALEIVHEQMEQYKSSGLLDAASEFLVGVNGSKESEVFAETMLPAKAKVTYHGLASRAENLTCPVMIENWLKENPGEAYIHYAHCKSATHAFGSEYSNFANSWRRRMMFHCVTNWRQCVADLDAGYEACGSHWLTGQGHDHSQHYYAGNVWFAKASFLRTIPSIYTRQRIKDSGIAALESRYESEVHMGNGPRLPRVRNYYDGPMGT